MESPSTKTQRGDTRTSRLMVVKFDQSNVGLQDKAVDQLYGICTGILADGEVSPKEAEFFGEWIRRYAGERPVWPLTEILVRIERIFADGVCDKEECEELRSVMESICGYTSGDEEPMASEEAKPDQPQTIPERRSITLPLCNPAPDPLMFQDRRFVITGKFAFGTRKKVIEAIEQRGGTGIDDHPCRDDHFLLIGAFPSKLWAHGNFGRKIEYGVQLRGEGSGLCIISEEHWRRFL